MKRQGFTLIEMLIGISIFLTAFLAFSSVSYKSLENIQVTKRKIVAEYLAEEGIEYVKNFQKSYILQGRGKLDFLYDFTDNDDSFCKYGCDFYMGNKTSQDISGYLEDGGLFHTPAFSLGASVGVIGVATYSDEGSLPKLYENKYGTKSLQYIYGESATRPSEYARLITVEDVPNPDPDLSEAILVTSRVWVNNKTYSDMYSETPIVTLKQIIHFNFN
jgi:prepilin-type N-terminal cleavage/methylation domain-containing protein